MFRAFLKRDRFFTMDSIHRESPVKLSLVKTLLRPVECRYTKENKPLVWSLCVASHQVETPAWAADARVITSRVEPVG